MAIDTVRPRDGEVRIRIGGAAGTGIKAAGLTLTRAFQHAGLWTHDLTEYPSLIKGGHNTYVVRVAPEPMHSHVEPIDVLIALDRETVDRHRSELVHGGAVIFDPDVVSPKGWLPSDEYRPVPVPLKRFAEEVGSKIMQNSVALGAVCALLHFPPQTLATSIAAQFAAKSPEVAGANLEAVARGFDYVSARASNYHLSLSPRPEAEPRVLVDGNEAIGLGALAAGIGFYAAYPMTPASSLLHFMAAHESDAGVVVKHTEDELAAMNMTVGAAFTGARAMCATSGGGFALMTEAFGLAGVTESAVVVGVIQRPGPATGMPTWTEQGDLLTVLHAAQGEFPRVILAPGSHEDAFRLTWQAFNLADQLQTPVVILGDSYLSDNRRTVPVFDTAPVAIDRGALVTEGEVNGYLRYRVTDDGVSERAVPGVRGALQVVNSYEHDEYGFAEESAAGRVSQNDKRMRKLDLACEIAPPPAYFATEKDAAVSIVTWGSTTGPVREAVEWLERDGIAVSVMQVVTVWPFPAEAVGTFLGQAKHSLCVEGNATGQLESLIRRECLVAPDGSLRRYDGRPISPEQVYACVKEVL